jgi:hypothetical protein
MMVILRASAGSTPQIFVHRYSAMRGASIERFFADVATPRKDRAIDRCRAAQINA